MPKGPSDKKINSLTDAQAQHLIDLYAETERQLMAEYQRALLKGNKTEYLKGMLQNVQTIINDLQSGTRTWCEEVTPALYLDGMEYADQQLAANGIKLNIGFGAMHQQAMQVLAENTYQSLSQIGNVIGRQAQDIYRNLALESIKGSVAGWESWAAVAKRYREELAKRGVVGFTDKAGREWNMRTYAGMVARTSTMEAHLAGTANRLLEHGHDLVEVTSHINACELCQPWQGRKLSLTGKTPGYPTVADAKEQGLFHPNCGHAYAIAMTWEEALA